jgi:hypothetical protein
VCFGMHAALMLQDTEAALEPARLNTWMGIVTLILAATMNEGAVDSLQVSVGGECVLGGAGDRLPYETMHIPLCAWCFCSSSVVFLCQPFQSFGLPASKLCRCRCFRQPRPPYGIIRECLGQASRLVYVPKLSYYYNYYN